VNGHDPTHITEFSRVHGSTADPVSNWPYEGLVEVLERGGVNSWLPIVDEIESAPWGPVARRLEKYLAYSEDRAIVALFSGLFKKYRTDSEQRERDLVAERVRAAIEKSQLPAREFADRIGTSASRLSTYATGKVIPSAAMLMRIENYSQPSALSTRHNHS
jgi:hypothetical protein